MKDLLKEAIADAKAVRETALANAKLALEEAFTPRLQSIISAQLQNEEAEDEMYDDEEEVEMDAPEVEGAPGEESAPEVSAEEAPEAEVEDEEEEDIDLEEIIRELEGAEDDMEMDEELDSSEVGVSDNKKPSEEASEATEDGDIDLFEDDEMSDDEEIDLDEIINSLKEEDDMDSEEEVETSEDELEEAYNVIRYLKDKINEVNLLNAKLLYSNKLFKSHNLNENQKMKVIENFDRAVSLREVKLVYSTLAESFKQPVAKKVVKESFASRPVASTKPSSKTVLTEGTELANRFKKLAGLI